MCWRSYRGGRSHRLDLPGVDANDPDAGVDELLAQALGEAADGGLGGAVDAAAGVRLATWVMVTMTALLGRRILGGVGVGG